MELIRAGNSDLIQATRKTITFTGAAGLGLVGAVPLYTVTGAVVVEEIAAYCSTGLGGATATISLGVTGNTAIFIAATLGTDLATGELWVDATPTEVGAVALPAAMKQISVAASIIGTVAVANLTSGVLQFLVSWRPVSSDGAVVAV